MDGRAAMISTHTIPQEISVSWDFPVTFTHRLFDPANPVFAQTLDRLDEHRRHRVAVFIDSNVAAAHPQLTTQISYYFGAHPTHLSLARAPRIVPGGEAAKNDLALVEDHMRLLLECRMDRQSFVVIIGGGAVM